MISALVVVLPFRLYNYVFGFEPPNTRSRLVYFNVAIIDDDNFLSRLNLFTGLLV